MLPVVNALNGIRRYEKRIEKVLSDIDHSSLELTSAKSS